MNVEAECELSAEWTPKRMSLAIRELAIRDRLRGLAPGWQQEFFPTELAPEWSLKVRTADGVAYRHTSQLSVIVTAAVYSDDKRWLHASCARHDRLPSWNDLRMVKDTFIGRERKAIQVLPAESEYVNIHPYCLHLWACLDDDLLPDFSEGTGSI